MTTNELKMAEDPPVDVLCKLLHLRQCVEGDALWVELLRPVRTEGLVHWSTLCYNVHAFRSRMSGKIISNKIGSNYLHRASLSGHFGSHKTRAEKS
jgi:hypothetical protein